jgi:cell division protein FtsN
VVPREEQPVDVAAATRPDPRVIVSPYMPTGPAAAQPQQRAGTTDEPRRIRTVPIRNDQEAPQGVPQQPNGPQAPAGQPFDAPSQAQVNPGTPVPPARAPRVARPAPVAPLPADDPSAPNAPMQLSPQGAYPAPGEPPRRQRVAAAPAAGPSPAGAGYFVQVSSQRSEADAQASYRALRAKFPGVLGSHVATVRRVDIPDKGTYYRAVLGPFGSPDDATRLCSDLKSAGGQCIVQRN